MAIKSIKQLLTPTSVAGFPAYCSPPGYGLVTYTPENGWLCNDYWLPHKPYAVYYCSKWCFFKASLCHFHIGGFTAVRLPGQVTRAVEPLCHSWIFSKQYPQLTKIYPGNARACLGLEPPMHFLVPLRFLIPHVGIPFWTAHKRQSQTLKFDGKTTILCSPSHLITHYHYVHIMERYTEPLHVKKMADLP